ncbi:GntR family transcriptional regulator [Microbacterium esteraromaticum]|uniref:GntR family transcriptional regulator n=1 Tax=Microbacterium esteraromaticum TaxID=57043 RepID=A0A939ISI9_9MICO|nr:GntR family transcriptional regulator [Microbacterium esteraromaticum]MBN7793518.1 GntR family transcriptional regulator [Microbacterium esteraromaticum]MBN8205222.1 GntR family transcriptional regulator [Microbacterium esteraromaticum]MBN8415376.1 GntR family transcriptional regulator [Microbacterium esteraromaticum]MBN8424275.1 GntR family transcriptional regulator [Microbacterium esteraromaticum]MBY6060167.1 GntR family transcriptional regulator [Microbacterium esteraromaticum]
MNDRRSERVRPSTGTPAYRRIATALWEQIQSGELAPGERLPNEADLAARFGVTRLTLRQAVIELQRLGAVEIRRGVGTFVMSPPDLVEIVASVPSLRQESDATADALDEHALRRSARPVRMVDERILQAGAATGPFADEAAAHLDLPVERLHRLDTVMVRDGRHWIANSYWFDERWAGVDELVDAHALVVRAFADGFGLQLGYLWRAFSAVGADFDDAETLGVPTGTALLVRDGVSADESGHPVFYVRRRLRGDDAKFVLRYDTESARVDG